MVLGISCYFYFLWNKYHNKSIAICDKDHVYTKVKFKRNDRTLSHTFSVICIFWKKNISLKNVIVQVICLNVSVLGYQI